MRRQMMRTTVTVDDDLMERAAELSGIEERSSLVRAGLETLVRVEAGRRLAALGGSDPDATAAPRRRSARRAS
ncbi:type II toxin-antitoxin system VapB family antitoxin [Nocardioides sp. LHD-245]|uniref:type II toxin-antitoxin system VapB family antitoxin n=1 Tax=Nocardioides sp. LHD-245 TaxID=3051387 RepID=UPI0027DF137B|nr:type II toxin-antitoxin system VapB family antitoxin [Nocardioides sp. LHD-245]